jgi:hypothetical protein
MNICGVDHNFISICAVSLCDEVFQVELNVRFRKSNVTGLDDSQDMKKLLSMDYQREWLLNKSAEYTKEMKAQLVSMFFYCV